jgi:hypothetical protein
MYKSLLQKINNILKLAEDFEELNKKILLIDEENNIPENMFKLTHLLVLIRAEHGSLILLFDKMKTNNLNKSTELNDEFIENCYDISTFNSTLQNITSVVDNIDFKFKTLATKYPKFVNLHPTYVILMLKDYPPEKENKALVDILLELQKELPENCYKVIFCEESEKCKVKLNEIINKDVNVTVTEFPSIYIVTDNNITEIRKDQFSKESLKDLLV